jgi:hypothetical protein
MSRGAAPAAGGFRFVQRFVEDLVARRLELDGLCEFFLGAVANDHLIAIRGVTPDPYLADPRIGRLRHVYVRPEERAEAMAASSSPCSRNALAAITGFSGIERTLREPRGSTKAAATKLLRRIQPRTHGGWRVESVSGSRSSLR